MSKLRYDRDSLDVSTYNEGIVFCLNFQMTGLDAEKEHIIEMACLITEGNLKVVAEVGRKKFLI